MSVTKDAMYGGVATWDREKNTFNIHKSGQIFYILLLFENNSLQGFPQKAT